MSFMNTVNIAGAPLSPASVPKDNTIKLRVPVLNRNVQNALPPGTCKIKIGLGSKMELAEGFNLATINTSNYFQWSIMFTGGQAQLTGDLVASLPANFLDTATFEVVGKILGNSTITTNFLITNHNSTISLSDEDPTNNTSFLAYTVVSVVPVTFTGFTVKSADCNLDFHFTVAREINVQRYEIELSKDGLQFEKYGTIAASGLAAYTFSSSVPSGMKDQQVFARVKSVDIDGSFAYSQVAATIAKCSGNQGSIYLYPNPVNSERFVKVGLQQGLFDGNYVVQIRDAQGKKVLDQKRSLQQVAHFSTAIPSLASGNYVLVLIDENGKQQAALSFQKL